MQMVLNTVRKVDYDQSQEFAIGDEKSLSEKLAVALINPDDFNKLNLTASLHLKLSNKNGEVVVKVQQDKNVPNDSILMPISIWANILTGIESNELIYKNIIVNVESTRDPILDFKELISKIRF
jgi:formylmethanofuran dehydrogenase subunit D